MKNNKILFLVEQIWVNFNAYVMKKLSQITPQYSSFVDDQVLTSGKLNEFIEYFDEQDRLSRICLTGVGITCGFKIELNTEDPSIIINQGCGITTDGDLIKLQKIIPVEEETDEETNELFISNTTETFKDISTLISQIKCTHYKEFLDDNAKYNRFRTDNTVINLIELIPDFNAANNDNALLLTEEQLLNKVVVLYVESYLDNKSNCSSSNCDNQGQPNIQNIKALLIDKNDVENIVNTHDSIYNKHNIYEAIIGLPRTAVQRVVLRGSGGSTDNISTYLKLATSYKTKITQAKESLNTAFSSLFEDFSDLLNITNTVQNSILNGINNLDNFSNNNRIQYRYTLTQNISDSFNEIADLLWQLKSECCPDIEAFPKHLLLGALTSNTAYPELRHDFYPAPANSEYETLIKNVQSLVKRVQFMLDNFNINNTQNTLITPSLLCGNLGKKAIPAYFNVTENLLKSWDFDKTKNLKQQYNLSYHRALLLNWAKTPLDFELDCTNLYRIEGHQGQDLLSTKSTIDTLKKEKGLDFDYLIFDIKENQKEFAAFVREHPSLTHKGGVEKGGTLILLTTSQQDVLDTIPIDNDTAIDTDNRPSFSDVIIADFSVSYKIPVANNRDSCCSLVECTFPWISSLKYINNLSRSLLGTQSTHKAMPKEYVLQIIEYKINGTRILNGTTTIRIPLNDIFVRRMHAITDALNKLFDKGVVFDFNENQKRFVITRAKEDTFTIRLRENTMGVNNATYTYSNTGMFRNNAVFRADAMRCRNLKAYNPNFYEKLHKEIAPVNKDDDYGTYDKKWERWSKLTDNLINNSVITEAGFTRMIKNRDELSTALEHSILPDMLGHFQSVVEDKDLIFHIDGDWVNGTWVNNFMLDHRKRHIKNTHDDIVLFVNLRKFSHNETGVTKMSIYIENQEYIPEFDEYLELYKKIADVYFNAKPTGINAFRLN